MLFPDKPFQPRSSSLFGFVVSDEENFLKLRHQIVDGALDGVQVLVDLLQLVVVEQVEGETVGGIAEVQTSRRFLFNLFKILQKNFFCP